MVTDIFSSCGYKRMVYDKTIYFLLSQKNDRWQKYPFPVITVAMTELHYQQAMIQQRDLSNYCHFLYLVGLFRNEDCSPFFFFFFKKKEDIREKQN